MNSNIYDLLEIDNPALDSFDPLKTTGPTKHFIVRIGILVAVLAMIFIYSALENFKSYEALIPIFFGLVAVLIWILFVGVETIILHVKRKYPLRNTNLVMLGIIILLSVFVIVGFS